MQDVKAVCAAIICTKCASCCVACRTLVFAVALRCKHKSLLLIALSLKGCLVCQATHLTQLQKSTSQKVFAEVQQAKFMAIPLRLPGQVPAFKLRQHFDANVQQNMGAVKV